MERKISTERLFTLGNYRNIKIIDTIEGIPQELALNADVMASFRRLQLLNVDEAYFNYVRESLTTDERFTTPEGIEEAVSIINETRVSTLEDLKTAFASVGGEKSKE